MAKLEVIVESAINKAMQGDPKARAEVFKFLERLESRKADADKKEPTGAILLPVSTLDPEEWARAVEKYQAKGRGEPE